jgi:TolA-binding protein
MIKNIKLSIVFLLVLLVNAKAQKQQYYETEYNNFRRGLELFDKEKYGAAQKVFADLVENINNPTNEASVNAEYYLAICGVCLFNRDADFLLRDFIEKHPESPRIEDAYYQLGIFNYRKRKWENAIHWFKQVDPYKLSQTENHDFTFKYGYALFETESFEEASQKFFSIKDVDNAYAAPAKYYFAHIAYQDEQNQTALEAFQKLEGHEQFGPVVPFYISQLLYKQKKFDELIEYAPPLLENSNTKRAEEISRLIGESYYGKQQYAEAIPFLEDFQEKTRNNSAQDRYQLAYCYYQVGNYEKAIQSFAKLSGYEDELGQTSLYQLADCYLKTNEKASARNAFLETYKMGYDERLTQDALFNYAKLSYELQFDPYNKAIKAFNRFIEEYPNSPRLDEAYNYLTNLYLTSKSYDDALASIEKISKLDIKLQQAYQTIAYNKGIEDFQNRNLETAIAYLERSEKYPIDKNKNTLAQYWKAEAQYRLKNYDESTKLYENYIYQPLAILQNEFKMAHYSLGYAYYKLEDFDNAAKWFRKYVGNQNVTDSIRLADSYVRIGDCYFIQKEYFKAIDFYQQSTNYKGLDNDYGMLQTALAQGVIKKSAEKVETLEKLITEFPNSKYLDVAKFQLGRSFMLANETNKSINYFFKVVDDHPNSTYVKQSLTSLGLLYYNTNENQKALDIFKRVVNDYPNYEDSKEALVYIKNIYVEKGDVAAYADFVNNLTFVNITKASLDSTTYDAAALKYLNEDCAAATADFTAYLEQFNPANFALNAHFYRAECLYKANKIDQAYADYKYVIENGNNKFTESALTNASKIAFNQEKFNEALPYFIDLEKVATFPSVKLDAILGQMRCFYYLNSLESATEYADKVLAEQKLEKDLFVEASFIKAYVAENKGDFETALNYFSAVSDTSESEYSAESKYHMADIYFKLDSFKTSTQIINSIVSQVPSYDYWIAKGLILLADIFLAQGDAFQAKATLQSIVDNYDGDPMIIQIAETNLQKIIEMETEEEEVEEEPLEIDLGNLDDDLIDLFEEEEEVEDNIPGNQTEKN